MRAYLPDYELLVPETLNEALALLAQEPGEWRPFAGGTDLMVLLEAGKLEHKRFFSIWNFDELRGIEVTDDAVMLGALTTYTEVRHNKILQEEFPMLCMAARETGGLAIQNRGTIGGNIVNASPAADSPPTLLAYDAELELLSSKGARRVSYKDFHTGYKRMNIREDELLARVRLPRSAKALKHYYRKVGTRKAQAISKVCFAGVCVVEDEKLSQVRIALGSVAPVVLRCEQTEAVLKERAINDEAISAARDALMKEIAPIDDIRSTAKYRLRVAANLLEDFLKTIRDGETSQ